VIHGLYALKQEEI